MTALIITLAALLALAIARIVQLTRACRVQAREIEQARRMIDVGWIASGVAHDINNALFVITGTIQVLQLEDWPAKTLDKFNRIMSGAELCKHIVSNLLAQARDSELQREPGDIRNILNTVLVIFEDEYEKRGIRIVRDYGDEPLTAAISRPHMQRLFLNLLSNAMKAMTPGGGTLTVRSRQASTRTNGYAPDMQISIEDTGPGIPKQILGQLFTAFTTQSEQGTGLGLYLCRRIALKHGGMIEACNLPERGAKFTLTLPSYD